MLSNAAIRPAMQQRVLEPALDSFNVLQGLPGRSHFQVLVTANQTVCTFLRNVLPEEVQISRIHNAAMTNTTKT